MRRIDLGPDIMFNPKKAFARKLLPRSYHHFFNPQNHILRVAPADTPGPGAYDVNFSLLDASKHKHYGFLEKSKRFRDPKPGNIETSSTQLLYLVLMLWKILKKRLKT